LKIYFIITCSPLDHITFVKNLLNHRDFRITVKNKIIEYLVYHESYFFLNSYKIKSLSIVILHISSLIRERKLHNYSYNSRKKKTANYTYIYILYISKHFYHSKLVDVLSVHRWIHASICVINIIRSTCCKHTISKLFLCSVAVCTVIHAM